MNIYVIEQYQDGEILGVVSAASETAALDRYARTQGWRSFSAFRAETMVMPGEIRVAPIDTLGHCGWRGLERAVA